MNPVDDTRTEDDINGMFKSFEDATDNLKKRVNRNEVTAQDAEAVLSRAVMVDSYMQRSRGGNRFAARAMKDWDALRMDLDRLARLYSLTASWERASLR